MTSEQDSEHLLPADDHFVYFKNNDFINNKLINPKANAEVSSYINIHASPTISGIPGEILPKENEVAAENNTFKGNDFGHTLPPLFTPASLVVDGGENKCIASQKKNFPLRCN